MSQNEQILKYLQSGKRLTPMQALNYFNCFRLSARVYDLREAGHNIQTHTLRRGGKRYAQYYMEAS